NKQQSKYSIKKEKEKDKGVKWENIKEIRKLLCYRNKGKEVLKDTDQ
ncbi:9509_t:CDS:1, partial [Cetraspora pellucida]